MNVQEIIKMDQKTWDAEVARRNAEARAAVIADLGRVMEYHKAKRAESARIHAEREAAAALLDGGRDWSK